MFVVQKVWQPVPLQPLEPTSAIVVTGYIPENALRFSVNLLSRIGDDIAFHFNPRLDYGYVVRNTKTRRSWDEEEISNQSATSFRVFRRQSYVHILIFCTSNAFQVATNGNHFCEFAYRMPLENVRALEINGSLEDVRFRQYILPVYPDPNVPRVSWTLTVDKPLVNLTEVPITIRIQGGIKTGTRLRIVGSLKLLPHSFYVNLQRGDVIYPHPQIALHLNPRFMYGRVPPCVVMNSWHDGSWGPEERHIGHLSWMPGRGFLLTIHCEEEGYSIWLGDKMISEFKHRIPSSVIDTLKIFGDVALNDISMTNSN